MSRGIRDLRELICVSRLTIRDSDDEVINENDESEYGDELSLDCQNKKNCCRLEESVGELELATPDSGFATNAQTGSDSENSASELTLCKQKKSNISDSKTSTTNEVHEVERSKVPRTTDEHVSSKMPVTEKNNLLSVFHQRLDFPNFGSRSATPLSSQYSEGHYDELLMYIDGAVVSSWLKKSNRNVTELSRWYHEKDNFVHFAHFWLSKFSDKEKYDILCLEYDILLEELSFAFTVGLKSGKIQKRHLHLFLNAIFREYPAKLLSSKGGYMFLDYLDILSSEKKQPYRQLLSDVKCSTRTKQHAQWILAARSFALLSVWSAVINFYKNLPVIDNGSFQRSQQQLQSGRSSPRDPCNVQHMYVAIRCGFTDVINYLLKSGRVPSNYCNEENKSFIFHAVIHRQPNVLHLFLNQVKTESMVNVAANNGNTALHAAANSGHLDSVVELIKCKDININMCNPLCDNATPLHLAVMHGHAEVVGLLVSAGADCTLKMGNLTIHDIAREFDHSHIADLLKSSIKMDV